MALNWDKEELRAIETALFIAKANWSEDYAHGLLDEVEVVSYENWSGLLDKFFSGEVA